MTRLWTKLRAALTRIKLKPLALGLGFLVLGLAWRGGWLWSSPVRQARQAQAQERAIAGIGAESAQDAAKLKAVQADLETMKGNYTALQKELRESRQAQESAAREQKTAQQQQHATVQGAMEKMQALAQQQQEANRALMERVAKATTTPAPAALPKTMPKLSPAPAAAPVVHPPPKIELRFMPTDHKDVTTGPPPSATPTETAYLATGCFARVKVVTGVLATSQTGGALPALWSVQEPFHCPWHKPKQGEQSKPTSVPLQGCFVSGLAQANLGMGRALGQTEMLSCVREEGEAVERRLKGYIVGVDGTLGMIGRVETRDSAVLAKMMLASLISGFAEAMRYAKTSVVVTPLGGTTTTVNGQVGETAALAGLATAASQASAFYFEQARQLLPVIWVESGLDAWIVVQEGIPLEGFPRHILLARGEAR